MVECINNIMSIENAKYKRLSFEDVSVDTFALSKSRKNISNELLFEIVVILIISYFIFYHFNYYKLLFNK